MWLPFVEVAAPSDVSVREREDRLGLAEHVQVERGLADAPRLAPETVVAAHGCRSSSHRSWTTTSAPCRRSSSAWPAQSTPTTSPNPPARPASTPARASSYTAASCALVSSIRAARRYVSGA